MSFSIDPGDTGVESADEPMQNLTFEERTEIANTRIKQYVLWGMAVGLVPLPLLDLAALFSLQLKLLHCLARIFDIEFRADLGRSAIASLIGGALPMVVAPTLAASLGKLIPGIGQTLALGSQAILNGSVTYAIGQVFLQHFASGGTFLTFSPEAVKDYFAEQVQEGKQIASKMRGEKKNETN